MTVGPRPDDLAPWRARSAGAQAINRTAALLRVLARHGARGAAVGEVAEATGLPSSTVHRLLSALVDERLAERARGSRRYRLGMEIIALGAAAGVRHDLRGLARPILERIVRRFGHAAHLLIRTGYDVVCLDQILPEGSTPTLGFVGSRAPLGVSASGLVLLAFLDESDAAEAIAHNQRRLADHPVFRPEALAGQCARARLDGYCMLAVERNPRIFGLAVPVLGGDRRPLAALSITTTNGVPPSEPDVRAMVGVLFAEAGRLAYQYEQVHELEEEQWRLAGSRDPYASAEPADLTEPCAPLRGGVLPGRGRG